MSDEAQTSAQDTTQAETTAAPAPAPQKQQKFNIAADVPAEAGDSTETKDATAAKPQVETKVVPEKYDLKLPDGSQLNPTHLDKIASYAKEKGLSNEEAQGILEQRSLAISEHLEAIKPGGEVWNKQVDAWEAQALADPEIGGSMEALQANAKIAAQALSVFPESVKQFLLETGFGSHPDVIKGFVKFGREMKSKSIVQAGSAQVDDVKVDHASVLFPSHTKK